ncbi:hypothetical protein QBC37DRAFT_464571 [Rhypophila decipiens]|uniref:Uncharacterized protein n=1 Tax=Rhypophila decipiens TaxID=261697 RepID=A0AAN6YGH3_9PEZI|nr:hypothetical protein QBC37DRAFT_464571 [Rhypophila decipiens]
MKYYWIDPSCNGKYGKKNIMFDSYICEARALAKRALERLESPTDTDFARVFNVLFKTPKTATQKKYPLSEFWHFMRGKPNLPLDKKTKVSIPEHVMATLADFASDWELTDDQKKAHVRIYADNGARFCVDAATGEMHDPINHIKPTSNPADFMLMGVSGQVICNDLVNRGPDDDENPERVIMDFYPNTWMGMTSKPPMPWSMRTRIQATASRGYSGEPLKLEYWDIMNLVTSTVAHEFMHTYAYAFSDGSRTHNDASMATAGWQYIMSEKKEICWHNADAMALLMMAAGFADMRPYGETKGGYTLPRNWDKIPGSNDPDVTNEKWDPDSVFNDAARGRFIWHSDMTN